MKAFMDKDFLLETETAKQLFHGVAKELPVIDYHCHLSAKEIFENKPFLDLADVWLGGDHYKWRAMRANGIPEAYITGSATGYEKFLAYVETLSFAIGNPLVHWSHLELQRYFDIHDPLTPANAPAIWEQVSRRLASGAFTPQNLIRMSHVEALCTTEDPADDLRYHAALKAIPDFPCRVLPAFRPDAALGIEKPGWSGYLKRLSGAAGMPVRSGEALKQALLARMDCFGKMGCVASDHGFEAFPWEPACPGEVEAIFARALNGEALTAVEAAKYRTDLLMWLAGEYHRRGWAMELHIGALRDVNATMVRALGEATGYDTIADHDMMSQLGAFMNALYAREQLPKTILFCLNRKDYPAMVAMAGSFQKAPVPSGVQFGTAWWFLDHKDGMEQQMRDLAEGGLLGRFIGMLTDSRSFLSYPRHEYFRRILCNLVGKWVEQGEFPHDEALLDRIVRGVCYENVKAYLGL